uniref:Uncharacterized protein n=1 Tax=Oryza rufipogon TaxID=4529 RepID=A0A0E0QKC2_ORYRU
MTIKYRFSGTPLGLVRLGHSWLGSGPNPHGKSRRGKDTGPRKYRRSARFYPGPPRCFPLVIGREIFSFFGGEEKILLTRRHNERGRCGGDGCTARCDSDATATARSLLQQLTPPVATFFPALGGSLRGWWFRYRVNEQTCTR